MENPFELINERLQKNRRFTAGISAKKPISSRS